MSEKPKPPNMNTNPKQQCDFPSNYKTTTIPSEKQNAKPSKTPNPINPSENSQRPKTQNHPKDRTAFPLETLINPNITKSKTSTNPFGQPHPLPHLPGRRTSKACCHSLHRLHALRALLKQVVLGTSKDHMFLWVKKEWVCLGSGLRMVLFFFELGFRLVL